MFPKSSMSFSFISYENCIYVNECVCLQCGEWSSSWTVPANTDVINPACSGSPELHGCRCYVCLRNVTHSKLESTRRAQNSAEAENLNHMSKPSGSVSNVRSSYLFFVLTF